MSTKLSSKALTAITNANGSTGRVQSNDEAVLKELKEAGLIANGNGLTRSGRIARDRHIEKTLGELF